MLTQSITPNLGISQPQVLSTKPYLLVHQAAKLLNLSPRTVRHLAATGKLEAHKVGPKIWHIARSGVFDYRARSFSNRWGLMRERAAVTKPKARLESL